MMPRQKLSENAIFDEFKGLFETIPTGLIVFAADDPDFTIVAQNSAHASVSMTTGSDVVGRPVLDAFPDSSEEYQKTGKSELIESLRTVIKTKKPDSMPVLSYDLKDEDGQWVQKFWDVKHHPILNDNDEVKYIYQVTRDITAETKSARKLSETERQLDRAITVGGVSTWNWDLAANRVYGDKNLAFLFGYEEEVVARGLTIEQFINAIHPDDQKLVQEEVKKAIDNGSLYEVEYRTINRDGTVRWVIARGQIEFDEVAGIDTFPGVIVDITDRKQAEKNMLFLLRAGTIMASSFDYRQTLKDVAELAVEEVADWCTIEIVDDDSLELIALAHRDKEKVSWAHELREKEGSTDLTSDSGAAQVIRSGEAQLYGHITDEMLRASTKDEDHYRQIKAVGMSAAIVVPIMVEGKAVGVMSLISAEQKRHYTSNDLEMTKGVAARMSMAISNAHAYEQSQLELAERIKLQNQLSEVNDELEARVKKRTKQLESSNLNLQRSNRELENFAYVASHDLQEPLRKIQAFGNLLEEEYSEQLGDGRDYLSRMHSAAARMSALINDLLAFSRVTTKKEKLNEISLDKVVSEVMNDLEDLVNRTKGKVSIGKLPSVVADPVQMRQLFQNLIANALKFHKKDQAPVVEIKACEVDDGRSFCIEVSDNGVGFDEKYLDRIFAVFQRLNGRDEFEGTGIGLAVCRKIVERHGGSITARSKPGEGSTFIVNLPNLESKKGELL